LTAFFILFNLSYYIIEDVVLPNYYCLFYRSNHAVLSLDYLILSGLDRTVLLLV